jgi:hypothetical protein
VHDSVRQRYELEAAPSCVGVGAYRPDALKQHDQFKSYYPADPPE